LKELLWGKLENATGNLNLKGEGAVFNRIMAAGFELQDVRIPLITINLNRENQSYVVEKGIIRSNLFSSEIEGSFSSEKADLKIIFIPTRDFFNEYPGISSMVSPFLKEDRVQFMMKGTPVDPIISVLR